MTQQYLETKNLEFIQAMDGLNAVERHLLGQHSANVHLLAPEEQNEMPYLGALLDVLAEEVGKMPQTEMANLARLSAEVSTLNKYLLECFPYNPKELDSVSPSELVEHLLKGAVITFLARKLTTLSKIASQRFHELEGGYNGKTH